ncbi:MAG: PEP-CTERM sorting domain-containing protein [Candidatus Paceibacterota bacterium]
MRNVALLLVLFCLVLSGNATPIMPSFDGAPVGGWTTDRYQPNTFADIGTFQGRNDVLRIGIDAAQGLGNRGGQNSQFYNTQGMQYLVSGGAGSVLSADLWIPEEWAIESNGSRRTDMWGIMQDGAANVSGYPILGFTNYGGVGMFRAWNDSGSGSWQILSDNVQYGAWNSLAIVFTGTDYEYHVNGTNSWSNTVPAGTVGFKGLIMQAYNFNGDTSIPNSVTAGGVGNYDANWANASQVPEPGTWLLSGLGLLGLGLWRRRQIS